MLEQRDLITMTVPNELFEAILSQLTQTLILADSKYFLLSLNTQYETRVYTSVISPYSILMCHDRHNYKIVFCIIWGQYKFIREIPEVPLSEN